MPITALYAALLAPLFLLLSARVIGARRTAAVGLGDAGDPALLRRIRVHANFAEYVPFALLLLGLAEGLRTPSPLLHALGVALLAGRLLHAYGVSREAEIPALRVASMALTLGTIGTAALACLVGAVA
jgi:uncharacterized protein